MFCKVPRQEVAQMNLELVRDLRNILFRTLVITYCFTLFMQLATFALWDTWTGLTAQWFRTNVSELGPILVGFFVAIKFYAIFVLLAPALALHWTLKKKEKRGY